MDQPIALVIDGNPSVRASLRGALALRDLAVYEAPDGGQLPRLMRERNFALLIVEAPGDGAVTQLLRQAAVDPRGPVVVALAHDATRTLELIRNGCFDVLRHPPEEGVLDVVLERAVRQWQLLGETRRLRHEQRLQSIVGHSPASEEIRAQVRRLAGSRTPVCISGEAGTGKELTARALHELSTGHGAAFVTLRCSALDATSWESMWAGAGGLLARAAGGTLYLEELPDLAPELQARLLATLGIGTVDGGGKPDVRVVVAVRRPPEEAIDTGTLTPEAAQHLAGERIHIPPLRERPEDVAPLARHFVATICAINHLAEPRLAAEAVDRLQRYHWPQNVQELRDAMDQAVILAEGGMIHPRELPERVREAGKAAPISIQPDVQRSFRAAKREVVDAFECSYLRKLMEFHRGNVTAASHQAGMLRSALQRLLRKHRLRSLDFRGGNASRQGLSEPAHDGPA